MGSVRVVQEDRLLRSSRCSVATDKRVEPRAQLQLEPRRVAHHTWLPPVTYPPAPAQHFSCPQPQKPWRAAGQGEEDEELVGSQVGFGSWKEARPSLQCGKTAAKAGRKDLGRDRFHLGLHREQYCLVPAFGIIFKTALPFRTLEARCSQLCKHWAAPRCLEDHAPRVTKGPPQQSQDSPCSKSRGQGR